MTGMEQDDFLGELKDLAEWMQNSAPNFDVKEYGSLEEQIKSLNQDSGDFYEVIIEIHFNNGRYITLHNQAFETLVQDSYIGDEIDATSKDTVIGVTYIDSETDYTQMVIPISSICYISAYTQEIKWQERWDALSKDKKDDCIAAFHEQCENRH
jgi:hypothetical protein|nr:MAG TPA: hypothetical protein [Caudoviricetes sp.]